MQSLQRKMAGITFGWSAWRLLDGAVVHLRWAVLPRKSLSCKDVFSQELGLLQKLPVSTSTPSLPTSGTPCQSLLLLDFLDQYPPLGQDYGKMALAWPSFSVCIWSLRNSCIFVVPNSCSKNSPQMYSYLPAFFRFILFVS